MDTDKKCHVMIDIETYSTASNGVIRSLAAVLFNFNGEYDTLINTGIDIEDQLLHGAVIDQETVDFWRKQPEINRVGLQALKQVPLRVVLSDLITYIDNVRNMYNVEKFYIWSHGSNFDTVLLDNAYKSVGINTWWGYKDVRDTRTLFDLAGYTYKAKGGHNALEDAINQVTAVWEAYKQLIGRY